MRPLCFPCLFLKQSCCGTGLLRSRKREKAFAGTKTAVVASPDGRWCSDCAGRGSAARGVHHQITTFLSSPRTIASPALQSKASANTGKFDGAPNARKLAGAAGSVVRCTTILLGGTLRHPTLTVAQRYGS